MKKLLVIVSLLTIGSYATQAQKIGYFNSAEVLKDNKEIKKVDTSLNTYLETLKVGFTYLQDEYNEKSLKLKDSLKLPDVKKKLLTEDVASLGQKLNSYQNDATQKLTQKMNELLAPTAKKLNDIVESLAKENKYDLIIDIANTPVFYINKTNDLTKVIIERLK
jgi:outer membrane protein